MSVPLQDFFGAFESNGNEFVKDENLPIWTQPEQISGIKAKDACAGGYHTIVVTGVVIL